jgi:hypothetical protein
MKGPFLHEMVHLKGIVSSSMKCSTMKIPCQYLRLGQINWRQNTEFINVQAVTILVQKQQMERAYLQ